MNNETLGYFLVRIYLFLTRIGINPDRLRFRQHMANEMAHYACDCWDAEIHTSYGWIECVGCADRSAYDLTVHTEKTKEKLVVSKALAQPRIYQKTQLNINRKVFGSKFKKDAKIVEDHLNSLSEAELDTLAQNLQTSLTITASNGASYELTKDMLSIERVEVKEHSKAPSCNAKNKCASSPPASSSPRLALAASCTPCSSTRSGPVRRMSSAE